ncbi:NH(3)-dependent NAD(+) synthetase [compost metagenome]
MTHIEAVSKADNTLPIQFEIINALGVVIDFDVDIEIERRVNFLQNYLRSTNTHALVLGISGGVDSLTAGLLAQWAVNRLRADGYDAEFIAVRLPYGEQRDEAEAQLSLETIKPDRIVTVNIKPATDAMVEALGGVSDFHKGNIKARQRMIAQYALAGAAGGLVIGTDHCAEALMGFYTKFGDGAADILPLTGLNKRRVRAVAARLGAPEKLVFKTPTADLETDNPGLPDEVAFGLTYDVIDDFLEGKTIDAVAAEKIISTYNASQHKRDLPYGPAV